jgi:hypothetical protein
MRTRAGAGLPPGCLRRVRSVAGAACLWLAARRRGSAQPARAAGRHAVSAFGPAARLAMVMMVCLAARLATALRVCLAARLALALRVCPARAAGRCVVAVRASDRAAGRCGALVDLALCRAFPADSREVAARHGAAARRAVRAAAERRAAVPVAAVPELHAVPAVVRAVGQDAARCEEQVAPQVVVGVEAAVRKVAAADAAPAARVAEHRVAVCALLRCAFCVAPRFRARPAPGRG